MNNEQCVIREGSDTLSTNSISILKIHVNYFKFCMFVHGAGYMHMSTGALGSRRSQVLLKL